MEPTRWSVWHGEGIKPMASGLPKCLPIAGTSVGRGGVRRMQNRDDDNGQWMIQLRNDDNDDGRRST
jgi:hypothetical protein